MRIDTSEVPTSLKFKNPSGLFDVLPDNLRYWHHAESLLTKLSSSFGYNHMILPPVEAKSLYTEAFGTTFDDTLVDSGIRDVDDQYVLRAHPRLGIIRSYKENGFDAWPPPFRVYFQTSTIQKSALGHEQHHYFCLDCLEAHDATTSASTFVLLRKLAEGLGIRNSSILLHSSGCPECRPAYDQRFKEATEKRKSELCMKCSNNITPTQITNCEQDGQAEWLTDEIPAMLDAICPSCHSQLSNILEMCDDLAIPYDIAPLLFASGPEAEQTTFALKIANEVTPAILGFHYNSLAGAIAGVPLAAFGITIDMERLSRYLENHHVTLPETEGIQVFVAQLGAQAKVRSIPMLQELYGAGYCVVMANESESITQQLQVAERMHARVTLIIGQKEAVNGHVIMRDMVSGLQDNVFMDDLIPALQERLAVAV